MKNAKLVMMGLGVVGVILCFVHNLPSYGTHGLIVLISFLVPVLLGALGTLILDGMPRWASALSAIAFLVAVMKTRTGDDFRALMVAAAAGCLIALALLVKPDRRTPALAR